MRIRYATQQTEPLLKPRPTVSVVRAGVTVSSDKKGTHTPEESVDAVWIEQERWAASST